MAADDEDADIPETGAVFTFGKSKFADNVPNKFYIRNDRVIQVACGDEHTALVAESGRVFTFGANDWGQLGLGHTNSVFKPMCIKSMKQEKVRYAACGRSHTLLATDSGKLYSFGANSEGQLGVEDSPGCNVPRCIDTIDRQQYRMLAAGADHSVALTDKGQVYVWGSGSEGQLGLGDMTESLQPSLLPFDKTVVSIACGYYHTALVTDDGELYTFGESESGKLGLGDDNDETDTPQHVSSILDPVTWVSCGAAHTVAVTVNGHVYTFGEGSSGQLGQGTVLLQLFTPRKLQLDAHIQYCDSGDNHTALISDKGRVYTFGDGRHGKLGLGNESFANQFKPCLVPRFNHFSVNKVACGGCHMMVMAAPRHDSLDLHCDDTYTQNGDKSPMNGDAHSLDLSASFSARDRRRQLVSPSASFSRTLPSLSTTRALPPLFSSHNQPSLSASHNTLHPTPRARIQPIEIHDRLKPEVEETFVTQATVHSLESSLAPKPIPRIRKSPRIDASDSKEPSEDSKSIEKSSDTKSIIESEEGDENRKDFEDENGNESENSTKIHEIDEKSNKKGRRLKGIFSQRKSMSESETESHHHEGDRNEVLDVEKSDKLNETFKVKRNGISNGVGDVNENNNNNLLNESDIESENESRIMDKKDEILNESDVGDKKNKKDKGKDKKKGKKSKNNKKDKTDDLTEENDDTNESKMDKKKKKDKRKKDTDNLDETDDENDENVKDKKSKKKKNKNESDDDVEISENEDKNKSTKKNKKDKKAKKNKKEETEDEDSENDTNSSKTKSSKKGKKDKSTKKDKKNKKEDVEDDVEDDEDEKELKDANSKKKSTKKSKKKPTEEQHEESDEIKEEVDEIVEEMPKKKPTKRSRLCTVL